MSKIKYLLKILKDRWVRPYDHILIRYNTKALDGDPLIWRVFVNGQENLASEITISGYCQSEASKEGEVVKYNIGCMGRVRWDKTHANIITSRPTADLLM